MEPRHLERVLCARTIAIAQVSSHPGPKSVCRTVMKIKNLMQWCLSEKTGNIFVLCLCVSPPRYLLIKITNTLCNALCNLVLMGEEEVTTIDIT